MNDRPEKTSAQGWLPHALAPGWSKREMLWRLASVLGTLLIAASLVFLVELTARGSLDATLDFFRQPFRPSWTTVALFALLLLLFDAVLGRAHQGVLIVAPAFLLLAFLGRQKSLYLGDPLYPTDILYARQILELLPLLAGERPLVAVGALLGSALGLLLVVWGWRFCRRRLARLSLRGRAVRLAVAIPALLFFVSIMDYATFSWTRDRLRIVPMMWDQKENYASNGFAIAFALNVPMAKVAAPDTYGEVAINAISADPAFASLPRERPDIIVVMSESFWDPARLPGVAISPDPIPVTRANQSGHVFSPEFGGMTANVEFEALTGFSNAFLPYGSIPYQQYVRAPLPSLASFLDGEGYETRAIHPFEGWFWNRGEVYDAFGFEHFSSEENLPPLEKRGPLASDKALTEQIIKEAEQARGPLFLFAVSLQGHGPYEPNRYADAKLRVSANIPEASRQAVLSYAEGASDADAGLGRLMEWARTRERHTVIAFFGDHLPPLGQAYVDTGFMPGLVPPRREPAAQLAAHRETPLVLWSNRTGAARDVGAISPAFLPLFVLKEAGITHPYYTGFLGAAHRRFPVIDRHLLLRPDGTEITDWSRAEGVDPSIRDFRLLQYDLMFGEQFGAARFFPKPPVRGLPVG